MLNFCSLYSGSTGNSLFIESENTKLLIDAGVSGKKIIDGLISINSSINYIDGILVTHEHSDHITSIGTLSKKYNIPVYATKKTWSALGAQKEYIKKENRKLFNMCEKFEINDFKIFPFSTPHDAIDSCGFNIYKDNVKISIATDLGHVTNKIYNYLENSLLVFLESNYEPELLKYSSYPFIIKKRIASNDGHLSNIDAAKTILKLIPSGLKTIFLGHLSRENNFPELVKKTIINELLENNYDINSLSLNIARLDTPSKLIKIS